jgi:DNA-binding PadR family transcriptional regulator
MNNILYTEYSNLRSLALTNVELAVLSLLSEQPRHGYDIEAQIEARGMREWTEIGFSSIYATLKKLARKGWVQAETTCSVGQGAPRKVYRVTPAGREAQQAAVLEALSAPGWPHSSLLLGLANLPVVSRQGAIKALAEHCQALEAQQNHLCERLEEQRPLPPFVEAMFDYSLKMLESELLWLRNYQRDLEVEHGEG